MKTTLKDQALVLLGLRMRTRRHEKEINRKAMAGILKIKVKRYAAYEEGENRPSVFILQAFCKALDISIDDLLEGLQDVGYK